MIRIATERLIVRDPLPADMDGWHRLLSDPKAMYYLPELMTRSLDESRENLEAAIAESQNPNRTKYFLAIEKKDTGAYTGSIGYTVTRTTPLGKLVCMGYFILPEYHGQGIAAEALRGVLRFAFEENDVFRVEAGCITDNRASERVMQKCGMIKEAAYKACVWHDGRMKDRVGYRLLREEYDEYRRRTMINDLLSERNLPDPLTFADGTTVKSPEGWRRRREEIKEILCQEEYGFPPPPPLRVSAEILEEDHKFCAGNAALTKIMLTAELEHGAFSFPVSCAVPKSCQPCPAFVHINFRDAVPDRYMPSEEICDHGFAAFSFCYTDISSDDGDFTDGLAGLYYQGKERGAASPGKIALWSWAAMRIMDYVRGLDSIDQRNIAVAGHSRLGKTALLTGALDERFAFTISNNSGCGGAALSRGKQGETIALIYNRLAYWFCENFGKYAGNEAALPFDQHFLLSLIAPRNVCVASAEEDLWADPVSEFLSCAAAAEVYTLLGEPGLACPDRLPAAGERLHEGGIGYHLRKGCHYFSRYDWNAYMNYIMKHKNI